MWNTIDGYSTSDSPFVSTLGQSQFNDCMDRNDFGGISRMAGAFVRGVTRADRLEQSTYGQSAVADGNAHRLRRKLRINSLKEILKVRGENPNYNAAKDLLGLGCCDDLSSYGPSTILDVSACKHVKDFQKASLHAPLLSVSGWLDTTAADAISSFAASEKVNPYSKLVIGPWNHGGLQQVRLAKGEKSTITAFDLIGEIMDFLETHLARRQPRLTLDEEPAVHYYCMGSGEWKASCSWPPIGQSGLRLYLAPGLLQRTTTQQENEVHYEVDFQLSPKGNTRWNAMLNYLAFVRYDDFGPGYLHFVSEPLDGDLEVTGSPILEITLRSSDQKADIFAYLLDLDPAIERSLYVTEGCFRCAHYRESDLVGESDDARLSSLLPQCPEAGIPPHSFRRKDFVEHLANEPTMVRFDLAPTSYKFRKGNRVALAIGGADHSEFSLETSPEPMPRRTLTFFLGGCHPSCLVLPVVRQA
uniref:Xaa-Pro dipeptidyl-peptidase C-terminal domain-containing protein n=1 Tax=Compsopogon caeruleus TaxID=31354 RepID=A0A7S1TBJ5_9RHOD|mmetsp:Transcript_15082/g.30621  ORF Transcript_15082/g.30621 Transcript_15082/m.30621 type:complete len:472 (+) Transcript_15082:770-2185(+)